MDNQLSLAEENLVLKTKVVEQLEEIVVLKQQLLKEMQDSVKILEDKQKILDKFIENNKKTIEIIETLSFCLTTMQKVMNNMDVLSPNRQILSDAFEEIKRKENL